MRHSAPVRFRSGLVLLALLAVTTAAAAANPGASGSYAKLPLHFEANQGQTDASVKFLSRGAGYGLYLTSREAVLVLAGGKVKPVTLRMSLEGAREAQPSGQDELPGKVNYFVGSEPSKWRRNVPTYARVRYREVYPGIDLVFHGDQHQLEYDFVLAAGADPEKIALRFDGADKLEIDARGDLVLHAGAGAVQQKKPVVYQDVDGTRREVAGRYVLRGSSRVGFEVAAHDRDRPLVIDPVLAYSTYLGGTVRDRVLGIAVDSGGQAYVTGFTTSPNFPTNAGAFASAFVGAPSGGLGGAFRDAFVTKLSPDGSTIVYSTYLGGTNNDTGNAIAVDESGSAYITGVTSSPDFPTTPGAFATSISSQDAFVTKLDPTGSALVYSTYLGGAVGPNGVGVSQGLGIAVDAAGSAYVTGSTVSPGFPTTPGAFQLTKGAGNTSDAFVTKLNPAGSALAYSTYLGGSADSPFGTSGQDQGRGIAIDAGGNAYVVGSTASPDFPKTPGAFGALSGGAFVSKLDPAGATLVYSAVFGPGGDPHAIALDSTGAAYITGSAKEAYPATPGAFDTVPTGFPKAFVTKVDPTGTALAYSTFLGGVQDNASGNGIAVDRAGHAYVTGSTAASDFPTTPGAFQSVFAGANDAFVTELNRAGSALIFSSYLGGAGNDVANAIAIDRHRNAYVAGSTTSTNLPTTAGALQPAFGGGADDGFVAKIRREDDEVEAD